MIRLFVNLNGR